MNKFKNDDLFFDLEIRGNIFVNTQIYPAQNKIYVSFLEATTNAGQADLNQDGQSVLKLDPSNAFSKALLESGDLDKLQVQKAQQALQAKADSTDEKPSIQYNFLQKIDENGNISNRDDFLKQIADHVKEVVEPMRNAEIIFENLLIQKDYLTFAKRFGISYQGSQDPYRIVINHTANKKKVLQDFRVVYDTDDDYDPDQHGFRIGYNSVNYDETLIAYLLSLGNQNDPQTQNPLKSQNFIDRYLNVTQFLKDHPDLAKDKIASGKRSINKLFKQNMVKNPKFTPHELVDFNNKMFSEEYMNNALNSTKYSDVKTTDRAIYDAWNLSNRFIDVSAMNPTHTSLKACAMALGYQIQESDTNTDPTAPLKTFQAIADLIAYNVNDVYVTQKVMESKEYWNRFQQNQQLLKEFPYLIYQQTAAGRDRNSTKRIDYQIDQDLVSKYRLTINNTSTKFVTTTIAPYPNTKIKDKPVLDLVYPDAQIAQELDKKGELPSLFHHHPRNILDYIEDLLNDLLDEDDLNDGITDETKEQIRQQYQKIRRFYSQYVGKNFNQDLESNDLNLIDLDTIKDENIKNGLLDGSYQIPSVKDSLNSIQNKSLTIKYIRPAGNYVDEHHNGLSSYITLSLGGTHGLELREEKYQQDLDIYQANVNRFDQAIEYFNHHGQPTNLDHLGETIVKAYPNLTIKALKAEPLPFDETHTYGDLLQSSFSKKHPKLRNYKAPSIYDSKGKLNKKYAYTSTDKASHEDFDSYYPSLISQLAIFRNVDGNDVFTKDLYHPRLKMKALAKQAKKAGDMENFSTYQLRQLSMKLLVNAASGGGDMSYTNNIKCNNKMMAMRIIGQLFCWYIGQTLALFDARIPSTNTDGLYAMNIQNDLNDELVTACAKRLILKLGPEHLQLFVSKDSNNRLEKKNNEIDEARGAALTAWEGPSTQKNLDHPAITDYVLANYLAFKPDACNQAFDRDFALDIIQKFATQEGRDPSEILRFFQFPSRSGANKARFYFLSDLDDDTKFTILNDTNRFLLTKRKYSHQTLKQTGLQAVQKNSVKTRLNLKSADEANGMLFRDIITADPIAKQVIQAKASDEFYNNLLNRRYSSSVTLADLKPRDMQIKKIKNFKNGQPVTLINQDLHFVDQDQLKQYLKQLDIKGYLSFIEDTFTGQWQN